MTSWTSRSWVARGISLLVAARPVRCLGAAALLLAAVMPAQAFQQTALADGGYEYFFAAPTLEIRGAGDLDFAGLSFIEGVAGGFRVGAAFDLDWLGGENASLGSPLSTWSGLDTQPRSLSIVAGGELHFGSLRLSLPGGTITLSAGESLILGDGSSLDVGGSGGTISGNPQIPVPPAPPWSGSLTIIGRPGGDITIGTPGGDISLITPNPRSVQITPGSGIVVTVLSPVPEPTAAAMLLAGLLALAGVAARGAKAEA